MKSDAGWIQAVVPKLEVGGVQVSHGMHGLLAVVVRQLAGCLGEFALLVALMV